MAAILQQLQRQQQQEAHRKQHMLQMQQQMLQMQQALARTPEAGACSPSRAVQDLNPRKGMPGSAAQTPEYLKNPQAEYPLLGAPVA